MIPAHMRQQRLVSVLAELFQATRIRSAGNSQVLLTLGWNAPTSLESTSALIRAAMVKARFTRQSESGLFACAPIDREEAEAGVGREYYIMDNQDPEDCNPMMALIQLAGTPTHPEIIVAFGLVICSGLRMVMISPKGLNRKRPQSATMRPPAGQPIRGA